VGKVGMKGSCVTCGVNGECGEVVRRVLKGNSKGKEGVLRLNMTKTEFEDPSRRETTRRKGNGDDDLPILVDRTRVRAPFSSSHLSSKNIWSYN
jgi:hypothetical protein